MRNLIVLFVCIAMAISCTSEPKIDDILITGEVNNPIANTIIVSGDDFRQTIALNADGTFNDTLKVVANGYYLLIHGRANASMYLSKGDNISVTFDARQFDASMKFNGSGSAENNYLVSKRINNIDVTGNAMTFFSLTEKEFKLKLDELFTKHNSSLERIDGDPDFVTLEKKALSYEKLVNLSSYQRLHAYYTKNEGFEISEDFLPESYTNMTFDNEEDFNRYAGYRTLAMNKYLGEVVKVLGDDYQSAAPEDFKIFDEIKIQAIKNEIMNQLGAVLVTPGNPNMISLYEFFMSHSTDTDFRQQLTIKFDNNKLLVRGMPSPQFTDYENHKGGTMSLADLRGKYVYIDVWATWCAPCIREIPHLKEIETKYQDRNIEFVSASIDRMVDHDAWVQMVKDKQLMGHQLFADSDWQSAFIKGYAIDGIPRFILVDPDGNIVSADAPRPSNPKLIALFEELKI